MDGALTWRGQYGAVLLGPTEHRVAMYLAAATRFGRVTLRTAAIADALRLERSEAYRITGRLRALGLFGIENDQGGTKGGRRWWRTPSPRAGTGLHPGRHRAAWARITAWARGRARRVLAALRALTEGRAGSERGRPGTVPPAPAPDRAGTPTGADPPSSLERWVRRFAPELAARWDADPKARPSRWREP